MDTKTKYWITLWRVPEVYVSLTLHAAQIVSRDSIPMLRSYSLTVHLVLHCEHIARKFQLYKMEPETKKKKPPSFRLELSGDDDKDVICSKMMKVPETLTSQFNKPVNNRDIHYYK